MMIKMLNQSRKYKAMSCNICNEIINDIVSYPENCKDIFHYKCIREYTDDKIDSNEPITCPECKIVFGRIANRYKKSDEVIYRNVLDENQCGICFQKYKVPVAHTDCCKHAYCLDCLEKWCTYKHECPMDRMPIGALLVTDFPDGPILKKIAPPRIEQDLNGFGDNDAIINTTCEICNMGNNDDLLLLCDNCDRGYHIYCLPEPLEQVPAGDWFCEHCLRNREVEENPFNHYVPRGLNRVIANIETQINTTTLRRRTSGRTATRSSRVNQNALRLNESESEEVIRPSRSSSRIPVNIDEDEVIAPVRTGRTRRVISDDSDESVHSGIRPRRNLPHRNCQESQSSEPESEEYIPQIELVQDEDEEEDEESVRPSNTQLEENDDSEDSDEVEDATAASSGLNCSSDDSYTPGQEIRIPRTNSLRGRRLRNTRRNRRQSTSQQVNNNTDDEEEGAFNENRPRKRPRIEDEEEEEEQDRDIGESSLERNNNDISEASPIASEPSSISTIPCTSAAIATRYENISSVEDNNSSTSNSVKSPFSQPSSLTLENTVESSDHHSSDNDDESSYHPDSDDTNIIRRKPQRKRRIDVSYNEENDFDELIYSVTSNRKTSRVKPKVKKHKKRSKTVKSTRKSSRIKKPKFKKTQRKSARLQSDNSNNNNLNSAYAKLSIKGDGSSLLPFVEASDDVINDHPSTSNNHKISSSHLVGCDEPQSSSSKVQSTSSGSSSSFLSKITDDQNKLFNMNLSNISRLNDGTIIHKQSTTNNSLIFKYKKPNTSQDTPDTTPVKSASNITATQINKPLINRNNSRLNTCTVTTNNSLSNTKSVSNHQSSSSSNSEKYMNHNNVTNYSSNSVNSSVASQSESVKRHHRNNEISTTSSVPNDDIPSTSYQTPKITSSLTSTTEQRFNEHNSASTSSSSTHIPNSNTQKHHLKSMVDKSLKEQKEYQKMSHNDRNTIRDRIITKISQKITDHQQITQKKVASFAQKYIKFYKSKKP